MTELRLHTIRSARGSRSVRKLVGRGPGSGKGKTGGRGTKGQRARSGGKSGSMRRVLKKVILRIPKARGFTSTTKHPEAVTLAQLDRWFSSAATVDVAGLKHSNLVSRDAIGVRIVHTGSLTKALKLVGFSATPNARIAIEKAGGSLVEDVQKKKANVAPKKAKRRA